MERFYCSSCHGIIGVYEPIRMILSGDCERTGSVLTLRAELRTPGSVAFHERCIVAEREPEDGGAGGALTPGACRGASALAGALERTGR